MTRASRLLDLAIVVAAIVGVWLGTVVFDAISR